MGRPQISPRMQPKATIDIFIADVAQEIFIGGDAERRRTGPPLDLKAAIRFDFGKIADRTRVSHNVTVADDAAPAAAGGQKDQAGEESDRNLIHNSTLADETTSAEALDSNNFRLFLGQFPLFSVRGLQLRLGVAFVQSAVMDGN